ncbi:Trk system potassium uptake protein TrkA [Eubacteriaceae bacterium CHKCI005]|nr:Trk system potassium uptake protein TrkA [Eubacteriaceae bacterium CHKCI005]
MRIVIVGGGKVGYFLCKALIENGHEVHLIEINKLLSAHVADELDIPVVCGDGTTLEAQIAADTAKADAFVAVTGRDEDNLIACQLANLHFHIEKTVARANNPKNEEVMRALGIKIPVSSTSRIAEMIEHEVDTAGMQMLTNIRGKGAILEFTVPEGSDLDGRRLQQIDLPKECLIISIVRGNEFFIPRGNTIIYSGDEIYAVSKVNVQKQLLRALSAMR